MCCLSPVTRYAQACASDGVHCPAEETRCLGFTDGDVAIRSCVIVDPHEAHGSVPGLLRLAAEVVRKPLIQYISDGLRRAPSLVQQDTQIGVVSGERSHHQKVPIGGNTLQQQ